VKGELDGDEEFEEDDESFEDDFIHANISGEEDIDELNSYRHP
jgi:hypothetical protein